MKLHRLLESDQRHLLSLPESGMGYQIIKLETRLTVIVNAYLAYEYVERRQERLPEELYAYLEGSVKDEEFRKLPPQALNANIQLAFACFPSNVLASSTPFAMASNVVSPPATLTVTGHPVPYYRYSAFVIDKRVAPDGSFLPGTYATTQADLPHVPSGFAAVGRYALPNPAAARYVFAVHTYDRPTLMGTAAPNFGQAGGGVEVFFANGAKHVPGKPFRITTG